jgi:hypothetical protein
VRQRLSRNCRTDVRHAPSRKACAPRFLTRLDVDPIEGLLARKRHTWEVHRPGDVSEHLERHKDETVEVRDYSDPSKTVAKRVATLRTEQGLEAIWEGPVRLQPLFEVEGSGLPVVVAYGGEKTSKSGRTYKDFDLIIDDAPEGGES